MEGVKYLFLRSFYADALMLWLFNVDRDEFGFPKLEFLAKAPMFRISPPGVSAFDHSACIMQTQNVVERSSEVRSSLHGDLRWRPES